MTVRVIYRSYGGENRKGRPEYYSKALALQSALRAAREADVEMVFINNGPIPAELVSLMTGVGDIVDLPDVGMRKSFLTGLRLPLRRGWADDDVAYFCEDDYLHTPDAFVHLRAAAEALPDDYFSLYGRTTEIDADGRRVPMWDNVEGEADKLLPRTWNPAGSVAVGDVRWNRILGTTSTFGARIGALRKDIPIFRQSGLPHRRMYRDWDMCVTYQGHESYRWSQLGRDLVLLGDRTPAERLRRVVLAPFKAGMNVRSHRLPANRHTLVCVEPNQATHLETAFLAPGRDWAAVAAETASWAAQRAV